jgi:membrane protein implicated in regulation of membrane protease activity
LEIAGPLWLQLLLFSIVSIATLLLFRRPLLQRMQPVGRPQEVDSLVGETALALHDIQIGQIGKAELRGTSWSARNIGANSLNRGQRCKVERVEGLTLCVRGE